MTNAHLDPHPFASSLSEFDRALLRNQTLVHARTRPLREIAGARCFEGPSPRLRYWLLEANVPLPADLTEVRTMPGAAISDDELAAQGFVPDGKLRYLWCRVPERVPAPRTDVEVVRAGGDEWPENRERLLRDFSIVQHEGYADRRGLAGFEETLRRNQASAHHSDETFFLARIDGEEAAASRTFFAEGMLGIYGVATRPKFQKRGLATELMHRAFVEARERKAELVTLQTWADSAPERLYRALGFVPAFDVGLYKRGESK